MLFTRSTFLGTLAFGVVALTTTASHAFGPYVIARDDGTIATNPLQTAQQGGIVASAMFQLYSASNAPLPDIMSVWTTFPTGGSDVGTLFFPFGNSVTGIGVATGDSTFPPLQSILLHNDVMALASRAAVQGAPVDGFARYLFLLELSHNWGPAIQVPGSTPGELIGFPDHWSFWMDAGGSPAGGNQWHDNGDGTFTTLPILPSTIEYSALDLYLMGLADSSEVMPFGVLENAVPPATTTDPLWGGAYAAHSFPWFASPGLTVTATRRVLTIDDVTSQNGMRAPGFGTAPTSWTLGIMLVVGANDTCAQVAAAQAVLDPLSTTFAPAFNQATGGRGTLTVVTTAANSALPDCTPDAGSTVDAGSSNDAAPDAAPAVDTMLVDSQPPTSTGCSCTASGSRERGAHTALVLLSLATCATLSRRRRPRAY